MKIFFLSLLVLIAGCTARTGRDDQRATALDTTMLDTTVLCKDTTTGAGVKAVLLPAPDTTAISFEDVRIEHPRGDTFNLSIPAGFKIKIVAHGMKRIRFMDVSPDGKIFLTDMFSLADNKSGKVYILDPENDSTFLGKRTTYLQNLRNPNSLAFHTDKQGKTWLYLALTDRLVRYAYSPGDTTPSQEAEVLDTYPDYGLSYRYGGWHLTRTIAFDDNARLYVSVGSSCNVCVETEEVRASIVQMDDNGKNRKIFARGVRNAVGLSWAEGNLFATNMAADHLGKDKPDDAMFMIREGAHYGWPYCYHWNGKVYADPKFDTARVKVAPDQVEDAFSYLGSHTAPLGLAWFGSEEATDPALKNYFLVAQHGSYTPAIGRGYSVQRVRQSRAPEDFVKGFLDADGKIHGRPCGILSAGKDRFYFTDDKFGTLYLVYK